MTEHSLQLVRENAQPALRPGQARHPLGALDAGRVAKHLVLFRPNGKAVDGVVARARSAIPGMTSDAIVHKVVGHNPDCLWAIARRRNFDAANPVGEGFIAVLPLNTAGLDLLATGALNTADPDLRFVCARGERPAGLYIWATYAPGTLAAGVALFMERMSEAPYHGVDLYTRPNTTDGRRFNETLGLTKGAKIGPNFAPNLYVFPRGQHKTPLYDSYRPVGARAQDGAQKSELTVAVARSFDDLMRVVCMRTAVYMSEQECPYDEEFDGNDLSGTHLLGYVGNEPAGCLRIRFFAGFAKLERVAVRKEYRQTRLAFQMVRAAIELCRVKGYHKIYGHAQKRLINFWTRFGFKLLDGGQELVFSDFDYVEMVAEFASHPDAITLGGDPYVTIRPEGRWHMPGILESSAQRSVTRPSIAARPS